MPLLTTEQQREIRERAANPLPGHSERRIMPGLSTACITAEASALLETAMEQWRESLAKRPPDLMPKDPAYAFAYWFIRWSGLIDPSAKADRDALLSHIDAQAELLREARWLISSYGPTSPGKYDADLAEIDATIAAHDAAKGGPT